MHDHAAVALLINPENPLGEVESKATEVASLAISQQLDVFNARNEIELLAVFAALKQKRMDALIISTDNFFYTQIRWLGALSAWHAIPAIGPLREFAVAGGLVSYAASIREVFRQAGVYVGRILRGAKAADLPVQQPSKFELVINLKTAKALGLTIPQSLLATADEVIE